jgi:hypothetical protein
MLKRKVTAAQKAVSTTLFLSVLAAFAGRLLAVDWTYCNPTGGCPQACEPINPPGGGVGVTSNEIIPVVGNSGCQSDSYPCACSAGNLYRCGEYYSYLGNSCSWIVLNASPEDEAGCSDNCGGQH